MKKLIYDEFKKLFGDIPTTLTPPKTTGVENGNRTASPQVHSGPSNAAYPTGQLSQSSISASQAQYNSALQRALQNNPGGVIGNGISPGLIQQQGLHHHNVAVQNSIPIPHSQLMAALGQIRDFEKEHPLKKTPTEFGEKIGWRMWFVKGPFLKSYSMDYVWAPHEPAKGVPVDYEHDGIWAFKDKSFAAKKLIGSISPVSPLHTAVYGSIKMWGEVIEHELGYRSSRASILSLDEIWSINLPKNEQQETLDELRKRYL